MAQLNWGQGNIGLTFKDDAEYYFVLGYLANIAKHHIYAYSHDNDKSGAWGGQGKLHNKSGSLRNLPRALENSFKLSGDDRLSVTSYITNLINNHQFNLHKDPTGKKYTYYHHPKSKDDVLKTVPEEYVNDFLKGYDL